MVRKKKQDDLLGLEEDEPQAPADEPNDTGGGFFDDTEAERAERKSNYVVLARRYRPQTFGEIVGQEHIRKALSGAIEGGQIGHAYLFSGPRGTGKTSTARILAKALNCQKGGPRPDPCGRCDSCRAITAGTSLDVIEIDAASNTGVDNIRELRGGVVLSPFSRYKVYIIDEVHMLSTQAFNALLKTLEEPPPQVVFVLATTENQKVPETIVSRCQAFQFRRFSISEIADQLGKILDLEVQSRGLTVAPEDRQRILDLLARNAEGGMRDAQVALDQVLVFSQDKLDYESVCRFLGTVHIDLMDSFIRAIHERKTEELLVLVDELSASGQDLELFVKNIVEQSRDLLIIKSAPTRTELISVSDDRYEALRTLASSLPPAFLLNLSAAFLKLSEQMKTSSQQRFLLEMLLIRLSRIDPVDDISNIVSRLQELEKVLSKGVPAASPAATAAPTRASEAAPRAMKLEAAEAVQQPTAPVAQPTAVSTPEPQAPVLPVIQGPVSAEQFLAELRNRTIERSHIVHVSLLESRVVSFAGNQAVLEVGDAFCFTHLNRNQAVLAEVAREFLGRDIAVRVQMGKAVEGPIKPVPETAPVMSLPPATAAVSPAPPPPASASVPVMEMPPVESSTEEGPRYVYVSPDLRDRTFKALRGDAFRQFIEKNNDLKELVTKVKDVFKIDDSHMEYRARI